MTNHEDWPTEETTVVRQPADAGTVIQQPAEPAAPFTPPPGEPLPPVGRGPDDGIGWGFLIGILLLLVIGGIVAAVLLTRNDHKKNAQTTTTVVQRTAVTKTVPAAGAVRTTTVTTAATPAVKTPPVATPSAKSATTTVTTTTTTATSSTPSGSSGSASSGSGSSGSGSSASSGSSRPTSVSVPDVGNAEGQDAVQRLNAAGLLVTLAYVPSNTPLGTVVAESPQAGASAQTGSHVTVNLSAGKGSVGTASVPDMIGRTIPQAVSAVKQAGVRMFFVRKPITDQSQAGKVIEQSPAAGTTIPKNAKVLVYMGVVR
jgi:hypothetical protein